MDPTESQAVDVEGTGLGSGRMAGWKHVSAGQGEMQSKEYAGASAAVARRARTAT
jgi:hypothetical protein